jgi:hypothetical protein
MMEAAPQTRSDWVYERLKQAIVSGELPPGTRLQGGLGTVRAVLEARQERAATMGR